MITDHCQVTVEAGGMIDGSCRIFMTGAVKKLSLQNIWFICLGLTGFGLKRNGAKMMEICYIFDSTIQHFLFCARLQFLEKQIRVFHSFFVSLFLQRRARAQPSTPVTPPPKNLLATPLRPPPLWFV